MWWSRDAEEWSDEELMLAAGSAIVARARREVTKQLTFTCSAGVAMNKLMAKLCGGLHKPNQQTVMPPESVNVTCSHLIITRLTPCLRL